MSDPQAPHAAKRQGFIRRWRGRRELHRRYKRAMRDYREGRMTVFETGAFLRSLDEEKSDA